MLPILYIIKVSLTSSEHTFQISCPLLNCFAKLKIVLPKTKRPARRAYHRRSASADSFEDAFGPLRRETKGKEAGTEVFNRVVCLPDLMA